MTTLPFQTIAPPAQPNHADDFDNLRQVALRHVAAVAAQPRSHAELVAEAQKRLSQAEAARLTLEPIVPTNASDVQHRDRQLTAARDVERAYGQLIKELNASCAGLCVQSSGS